MEKDLTKIIEAATEAVKAYYDDETLFDIAQSRAKFEGNYIDFEVGEDLYYIDVEDGEFDLKDYSEAGDYYTAPSNDYEISNLLVKGTIRDEGCEKVCDLEAKLYWTEGK
jgi:hypothetical protein